MQEDNVFHLTNMDARFSVAILELSEVKSKR